MNPNHPVADSGAYAKLPDAMFRAWFSAGIDAALLTKLDGRILAANPAACRLFDRSEEELCVLGREGVVDLSDPRLAEAIEGRRRHGSYQGELTFVRPNGEKFTGHIATAAFQAPDGEVYTSMVIRDVTESRRMLEALAASEERYRGLVESAFDGMVIHQDGHIVSVNEPYAAMFGYAVEELIGRPVLELSPPEVRETVWGNIQRGVVRPYRTFGLRKDGTCFPIETAARACTVEGRPARIAAVRNLSERVRAEAELRESEEKHRTLLENLSSGVIVHGPDTSILFSNRMASEILGLSEDQLRGKTAVDPRWRFLQEDGSPLPFAEFPVNRVLSSGQGFQGQIVGLDRPDLPEPAWAICNAYPVRNESGEIVQVIVTFTDITKRKKAEADLRESETALRGAQRMAQLGHWRWEIRTNRLKWSDQMFRIFGLEPREFTGDLAEIIRRAIHPEDRAAVEAANRMVMERGQAAPLEYRVVWPDGTVRTVWAEGGDLVTGADGRPAVLSGIVLDITERKRTETALRQSRAQFAAAFDLSPLATNLVALATGRIIEVNEMYCQFFGYTREEVIGRTVPELKMWVEPAMRDALMQRVRSEGSVRDFEARLRRKDGRVRDTLISVTPVDYQGAAEPMFLSILVDITGKKAMDAHLLQTQRMEVIGSLASGIAHDLNNILAPILLMGGLLKEKLQDPGDKEILELALAGTRRGADIIKQLLTFSRGQQGERVSVQIRYLIREIVQVIRETFPREIELQTHVAPDLWLVVADSTQLHQVLLNLCVNARDAMRSGGRLTIRATNLNIAAGDGVLPTDRIPGPYVCLEVCDTGHGIPPEVQHRVFDLFFTTKPQGEGTGLGLSIVLGIVQSHGGFIRLESAPGQGTSFQIFLPARPGGVEAPGGVAVKAPAVHRGGQTILVVDDERSVREATRILLERLDYKVLTAVHGDDALSQFLARRTEISLVLTDIMMPVMNGVAMVRAMRAIAPELKIIATSGLGDEAQIQELTALGVLDVLIKPCGGKTLIEAVHRHLADAG